jgi:hypothetical protein
MELECYLMNGQYDQVGTRGTLRLDGSGRLSFTLDQDTHTRGKLKWIEKALSATDVHDRLAPGMAGSELPMISSRAGPGIVCPR